MCAPPHLCSSPSHSSSHLPALVTIISVPRRLNSSQRLPISSRAAAWHTCRFLPLAPGPSPAHPRPGAHRDPSPGPPRKAVEG